MHCGEVVRIHLDAHLHAQVIRIVDVPSRRVAHHFAIRAGCTNCDRAQKVAGRGAKPSDLKKVFAVVDHVLARGERGGVALVR